MNYLAQTIIENAAYWQEKWQDGECKSVKNNRGNCIDAIKKQFGKEILNTPWCAEFVSVVVKTACEKLGVQNLLPYTRSTAAMIDGAIKNGLRVDSTPAVGSIFYRKRDGGGHVGIVVKITSAGIVTIEGNSNDAVLGRSYSYTEIASWKFIHIEELGGAGLVQFTFRDGVPTGLWVGSLIVASVGGLWFYNKKHHILPEKLGLNDADRSEWATPTY